MTQLKKYRESIKLVTTNEQRENKWKENAMLYYMKNSLYDSSHSYLLVISKLSQNN